MNTITAMIITMLTTAMTAITGTAEVNLPQAAETETTGIYADCGVILQAEDIAETEDGNYQITITMQNGNMFSFISEDGDWMDGELVAVIFDDCGTPEVSDDIIIGQPHYSGWVSDAELANWIK